MDKIKLKWRVFGFLLGFCVLLLVILWFFQIVFLNDFYRHIRIAGIRSDVATIIQHIEEDDIREILLDLSEDGNFVADIVRLDGRSVFLSSRSNPQGIAANLALIEAALENEGEFYEYSTAMSNSGARSGSGRQGSNRFRPSPVPMESLVYVQIVDDAHAVILNAVISPVNASIVTLRYQLYMISGIMLGLAIILAIILSKRVSKPLEELNHSALDLAKGRYDTRFSGRGFYEIVELSETLNTAAIELGRAEGLRRELLANVSHDLRTPLALIYSYAEMMHDFPEDMTQEQAGVIMEEAKRLTGLVNDVLDISKLEAGTEQLHIARFNLTAMVEETVARLQTLLNNQGYEITFIHPDTDIFVEADEGKISRVFYNLLINAVQYAGADQKVSVRQTVSDTGVRISVTDTGEGISKAELPFIWDRYYKSGKAHKRAIAGTGLGLSIVKKIMDLHGGAYGVTSEPGKGSTFWFELNMPGE